MISTTPTTRINKIQVEPVAQDDQAIQRPCASSAVPTISAKCTGVRGEDPEDGSMVHPDEGLILSGDKVAAAHSGYIKQVRLAAISQGRR